MKYEWYCLTDFHTPEECRRIREYVLDKSTDTIRDKPAEGVVKTAEVKHAYYGQVGDALEKMTHMVHNVNRRMFGFDLSPISNFDTVHMNFYSADKEGEYSWHADGVHNEMFDAKLTAILNLTEDEIDGGDFELFISGPTPVPDFKKLGSLIIFPSYINHRVLPVTKGTRITLAHWFLGPNLR